MTYDTFKEARKAAREYKSGWMYLGKIKKGNGKGKFIIDRLSFCEAEFIVNCQDGRVCKISDLKAENKIWNRHPEMHGNAYPFTYKVRNRELGEDRRKYLRNMAIGGRFKNE